jgi:hypothetical protein
MHAEVFAYWQLRCGNAEIGCFLVAQTLHMVGVRGAIRREYHTKSQTTKAIMYLVCIVINKPANDVDLVILERFKDIVGFSSQIHQLVLIREITHKILLRVFDLYVATQDREIVNAVHQHNQIEPHQPFGPADIL